MIFPKPDRCADTRRGNGAHAKSCVTSTTPRGILATLEEMQQPTKNMLQNLPDGLLVVGAEYSLETGVFDFFDQGPALSRVFVAAPAASMRLGRNGCTIHYR